MASKEFLAGWQAAREQYQRQGNVQPYPPEVEAERTAEATGKTAEAPPEPEKRPRKTSAKVGE